MNQAENKPNQETYSRMGDDELLHLVPQLHTLTEAAQAALTAELEKRKLNGGVYTVPKSITGKSTVEKLMFCFFISSAIIVVFHAVWPSIFVSRNQAMDGFGEMVEGFGDMSGLWLIIWLVLMARRIQKG